MNEQQKQDIQNQFTENLNTYMRMYHKQQKDLIEDLGFSRSAVSSWCKGTRMPKIDKVDELANYFKIKRSDLIGDYGSNANSKSNLTAIKLFAKPSDIIFSEICQSIIEGHLSDNEMIEAAHEMEKQKNEEVKNLLRTIEGLSEDDVEKVFDYIKELRSHHKQKFTNVSMPHNPNQPRKLRK